MKNLLVHIHSHPQYNRIIDWSKLIIVTGSSQIVLQLIGFVSGILIIRLLSTQEYATYTLANAMLGTIVLLTDGGLSIGVMSQASKVWQDPKKLGIVLNTGIKLRQKIAFWALIVIIPVTYYLFVHNNISYLYSFLLLTIIISIFLASISIPVLEIAPRLHQDILPLQKIQITASSVRLLIIAFIVYTYPKTWLILLAGLLIQVWNNKKVKEISLLHIQQTSLKSIEVKNEVVKTIKKITPGTIYYSISGQITIWILSITGSTNSIAQAGALSRLAAALSILSALINSLIIPRFAKLEESRKKISIRYTQINLGILIVLLTTILVIYIFPKETLFILGNKYTNLQTEVLLIAVSNCLNLLVGSSFYLCTSRNWILTPFISIPIEFISLLTGIHFIDLSNLKGVLILNILTGIVQLFLHNIFFIIKIAKTNS